MLQVFVILVALEVLLLCLRMLYFCMAYEHFGALLRMVLIVIKVGHIEICLWQRLSMLKGALCVCVSAALAHNVIDVPSHKPPGIVLAAVVC